MHDRHQPPHAQRQVLVILVIVCLNTIFDTVSHNLHGPFLRSTVVCSGRRLAAAGWTGSAHCNDLAVVLRVSQSFEGDLSSVRLLAHLVGGPLFGVLSDTRGRKLAVSISLVLKALSAATLAATAVRAGTDGAVAASSAPSGTGLACSVPLVLVAHVLGGVSSAQVPLNALLGDVSPSTWRGFIFTVLILSTACAGVAGTSIAAHALGLEGQLRYSHAWMVVGGLAPLPATLLLFVRATRPGLATPHEVLHASRIDHTSRRPMSISAAHVGAADFEAAGACVSLQRAVRMIMRVLDESAVLRGLCASLALAGFGVGGVGSLLASYTIGTLGWRQGDLQRLSVALMASLGAGAVACVLGWWCVRAMGWNGGNGGRLLPCSSRCRWRGECGRDSEDGGREGAGAGGDSKGVRSSESGEGGEGGRDSESGGGGGGIRPAARSACGTVGRHGARQEAASESVSTKAAVAITEPPAPSCLPVASLRMAARMPVERVVLLSLGTAAAGQLMLCLTPWVHWIHGLVPMALALALLSLAGLASAPAILVLLTDRFPPHQRATAQAVVIAAINIAFAVAAPLFSHLLFEPRAQGLRAALPFALGALCMLASLLVASRTFAASTPSRTSASAEIDALLIGELEALRSPSAAAA